MCQGKQKWQKTGLAENWKLYPFDDAQNSDGSVVQIYWNKLSKYHSQNGQKTNNTVTKVRKNKYGLRCC